MAENFRDYEKLAIQSGLAWRVEKRPLFDDRGNQLPVVGTFRSDNGRYLGTVTEKYQEFQNIDLFRMPEVLNAAGVETEFVRAGEMHGGERVFAEFRLPFRFDTRNVGDMVESSIIVSTRHDGRGSVVSNVNLTRLVCTNGMTMKSGFAIQYARHDANLLYRIESVKKALIRASEDVRDFGVLANSLSSTILTRDEIKQVVECMFYESETNNIYTNAVAQNKARAILAIFDANDGDEFKQIRGTAWNLFNAVTNYIDHRANYRSSNGETPEQARIRGVLFGAGHAFKWHALSVIVKVVSKAHSIEIPKSIEATI